MNELLLNFEENDISKEDIIRKVYSLIDMYKKGILGGEFMPEDSNPGLEFDSLENFHYFTLPMSLNYQRNSYKLWESAKKTYEDEEFQDVFYPNKSVKISDEVLKKKLLHYKIALQPVRHVAIWKLISKTIHLRLDGDIRNLFIEKKFSVLEIKKYIQIEHKKEFPYLSGNKICNYWLYVIDNYTSARLTDKEYLNVAPDTHVIQSSIKLGLVPLSQIGRPDLQTIVTQAWENLLKDTGLYPIDVHTPLWLWSRGGFIDVVEK